MQLIGYERHALYDRKLQLTQSVILFIKQRLDYLTLFRRYIDDRYIMFLINDVASINL